jgi:hypothetical protein
MIAAKQGRLLQKMTRGVHKKNAELGQTAIGGYSCLFDQADIAARTVAVCRVLELQNYVTVRSFLC